MWRVAVAKVSVSAKLYAKLSEGAKANGMTVTDYVSYLLAQSSR